jgi:hypothetical protein
MSSVAEMQCAGVRQSWAIAEANNQAKTITNTTVHPLPITQAAVDSRKQSLVNEYPGIYNAKSPTVFLKFKTKRNGKSGVISDARFPTVVLSRSSRKSKIT